MQIEPHLISWAMAAHPDDCQDSTCIANREYYGDKFLEAKAAHRAAFLGCFHLDDKELAPVSEGQ